MIMNVVSICQHERTTLENKRKETGIDDCSRLIKYEQSF